jgi:hypothetical protein
MRNPKTGGEELRALAAKEKLQLRLAAVDLDSDDYTRLNDGWQPGRRRAISCASDSLNASSANFEAE